MLEAARSSKGDEWLHQRVAPGWIRDDKRVFFFVYINSVQEWLMMIMVDGSRRPIMVCKQWLLRGAGHVDLHAYTYY